MELIMQEGFQEFGEAVYALINEAMPIERSRHLGAGLWERAEERQGHANGYNAKTVGSRPGERTLAVPQVRDGSCYPNALERDLLIEHCAPTAPKLAERAQTALPQGLVVFGFPAAHRRRLRTTNVLELLSKEIKQRTRVATLFSNKASCLRLVSAVAMEISGEWHTCRTYLTISQK